MASPSAALPILRQKICGNAKCRAIFTVCINCDRGQRYCGPACRSAVRRQQRLQANRRYQQSESGKQAHRQCQRRYRTCGAEVAATTDQGVSPVVSSPSNPDQPTLTHLRSEDKCVARPNLTDSAAKVGVTDQGIQTITSPTIGPNRVAFRCMVCGCRSSWFDPFPTLPRRLRSARRPKNYACQ